MTERRIIYVSGDVQIERQRNFTTGRGGTEWVAWRGDDELCSDLTLARVKKDVKHYHGLPLDSWKRTVIEATP